MKNEEEVRGTLNNSASAIQETIRILTSDNIYDTELITSLLNAKDAIRQYQKNNWLDQPMLW